MTHILEFPVRHKKNIAPHRLIVLLIWMTTLGLTACSSDDVTGPEPLGTLRVEVVTTGQALDPDGYWLHFARNPWNVNFPDERLRLDANGYLTFLHMQPGEYLLRIDNVADNCAVLSESPAHGPAFRDAVVPAGAEGTARFDVHCSAPSALSSGR